MIQHFKRVTALCLLVAMLFGLVGGVPVLSTTAASDSTGAMTDVDGNPIVNLLDGVNGDFEKYTIPGWSVMDGVVQSDEQLYGKGGTWALKLNDSSSTKTVWSMSDKNEIEAGEKYTISAQVYGGIGEMTVYFYDAAGNELKDLQIKMATSKASNSWQALSKDFTAAADAKYLAVKVSTTAAGTKAVYFDAVILAKNSTVAFTLGMKNGNFDAEWTGKIAPGWTNRGNGGTAYARVANGSGFAMSVTKAAGYGYSFRSDKFDVQGAKAYTFTIDVKGNLESATQFYLYFFDKDGTQLSSASTFLRGDYSSGWVTVAVNGIAPANAVKADVLITDASYTSGVATFDNAKISYADALHEPSFEGVVATYGYPVGTTTSNSGSYTNLDAAYVRTGKQSIVVSGASQMRTFAINVAAGENYEATVYAKRQAGATGDATFCMYLYFYDAAGAQVKSAFEKFYPTDKEWTQMKISGSAPEGAVAAKAMFYKAGGDGNGYFDDVTFTQTTDYNLVKNYLNNGGFESRSIANYIAIPDWVGTGTGATDSYAVDYMGGDHGYVARVFNTTYSLIVTPMIPITVGETYSVTVDAMGEGKIQAYIRYYKNESDGRSDYMKNEAGDDIGKFKGSGNLSKDEWTQLAVSGSVAPAGAKYVRIWIVATKDSFSGNIDFNFDNVVFFKGKPKLVIPGESGGLWNPGFEELTEQGMPKNWGTFGQNRLRVVNIKDNPDDVYEGQYALKIHVPADLDGTHGAQCNPFPVEAGVTYRLSLYAKEDYNVGRGFQLGIKYFDKTGTQIAAFYSTTPATGEWNYSDCIGTAPEGAVYATVYLVSGAGKGTVCFDKLAFDVAGSAEYAPEMFSGEWDIVYNEYPRLNFDKDGLERIKKFGKSKSVCAYGYAGTVTQKSLLKTADAYLDETKIIVSHKEMDLTYPLYPVLEDPTCRPEHEKSPAGFGAGYPYMTAVGQRLVSRVQTLALAYAVTGDVKYGERAKQYALDICNFKYWVGYWQTIAEGGTEKSSQTTGYMLDCVIAAYDMCYDLFSAEELAIMEKNLIEKGLEAMYHDCWPRMQRDRDMDHATGMILGACTILREDNIDQLKKYLDMGMTYVNWRLNFNIKSGVNEGHMYDSLAIDDIVKTLYTLQRVTGYTGPMDHPYMDELRIRVLGFFEMVNGTLPAYSDSDFASHYYPYSMAVFSQLGDELATYYLATGGALSSDYDKMIWFTDVSLGDLKAPDERTANVNFLKSHGQASLRTGWDILDSILVINANNSQQEHNHYDQNSILLAFNGLWMLTDSEYKDNSYSELTTWQMKYTNSTIFVDGKPQVRKGQGSLEQVFDTHVYGYHIGSAPDAYGMEDKQAVLNKFDRHTIMINHDSQPYYVIIDDLESNKDRNFGWNIYTQGWDRLELDGVNVEKGTSGTGNRMVLSRFGNTIHSFFVGEPVTSREVYYAGNGPTLVLESEKKREHQFMNILSVQKGSGSQISTLFEHLMVGQSSTVPEKIEEGKISWSTRRTDTTKNSILSVTIGTPLVMFRAGEVGDWISFPFEVPATKEYGVTIDVGQTMEYDGTWNLYIDGELIEIFKPHGPLGVVTIDAGKMTLEAGQHTVKVIMSGTPNSAFAGTICSIGGITLDTGESMGEGTVKVTEQYDEGDLLGATVTYGPVLKDVVLFNRGKNEIAAGGVVTNGQQASVIGINGEEIAEGYAVTKGTYLKYNGQTLVTSNVPVSVAMDYTMAKFPVKNDNTEDLIEPHEDFDINKPVYYVSAKADAAATVSINVGVHAPYTAYIDGEEVESTHSGEMLTLTIPEGEHQIEIRGTHKHVYNQYSTHVINSMSWATCEHGNIFYVSCVCGANGTETFTVGNAKRHDLKKVEAVEPTETEDGNIEHWVCTMCGRFFADSNGTTELTLEDVTLLNLADARMRQILIIVGISVGALVLAGGAFVFFAFRFGLFGKKKKQEEDGEEAGETPPEETPVEEPPIDENT